MLRKALIAVLATASIGLVAPTMAYARGGGGHGGGGFGGGHGFGGGAFHAGGGFGRGGFGGFHNGGFHGRGFGRGIGFGLLGAGVGYGLYDGYYGGYGPYADGYGYYGNPYGYDDAYADSDGCTVVRRRVHTTHGWRVRSIPVCG
jgi:hypothetical protein